MANVDATLTANWSASAIGFVPPIRGGLQFWFNFGGTLASSLIDRSPLARNAVWNGTTSLATVNSGYVTLADNGATSGSYVQETTGFTDTNGSDITFLAVIRSTDTFTTSGSQPAFITNFSTTDTLNPIYTTQKTTSLTVSGANGGAPACQLQYKDYYNAGSAAAFVALTLNIPSAAAFNTKFKVIVCTTQTVGGIGTRNMYNLTDGTAATTSVISGARIAQMSHPFQIGIPNSTFNSGTFDMAIAACWNVALTVTQINTLLYPFIQRYMSQFGFAV